MTLRKIPLERVMTQISWPVGNANDFGMGWALLQSVVSLWCYNEIVYIGIPLVIDTSALVCISPHRKDFITYCPGKIKIKDLPSSNKVDGEGLI